MRRLTIIRSQNDYRKIIFLQIQEQTYTSVFNGVVTMHPKTQAFLPLLIQGYIHAQAYACTVYVYAPPWYALLPQYKLHSRYAAACKRNEGKY